MSDDAFDTERSGNVDAEPCSSCPYRCDTPPGVWARSEYEKLSTFDEPTFDPESGGYDRDHNLATFLCHHSRLGRAENLLCRGWLSVHADSPAVRLAMIAGVVTPEEVFADVAAELYESGAAAAVAGIRDPAEVGPAAARLISRVARAQQRRR